MVLENVGFWRDLYECWVIELGVLCELLGNGIIPFPVGAVPVAKIGDAVVKRVRLDEGKCLLVGVCMLPERVLLFRIGEQCGVIGIACLALFVVCLLCLCEVLLEVGAVNGLGDAGVGNGEHGVSLLFCLPLFLLADIILPRFGGGLCASLEQHKADI